jgi:Cu/Ag efflux pump CusA
LFTSTLLSLFVLPSLYLRFGHRRPQAALCTAETEGNT